MIVLAVNPILGSDGRPGQQRGEGLRRVGAVRHLIEGESADLVQVGGFAGFPMVDGGFAGDEFGGNIGHDVAIVSDDHLPGIGDGADLGPGEVPFLEDPFDFVFAAALDDDEHAFLGLAEHDLVRGHVRSALRDFVQFDLDSGAGAGGGFAGRAGETGGAHVLDSGNGAGGQEFEAGLAHEFFHEGIADLNGAALLFGGFVGEILGGEGGSGEAIAAGGWSDIEDGVAHALGLAAGDLFVAKDPEAEDVDQRVTLVGFVEINLPGDGGDPKAIAVMGNAGHHAAEQPAHFGVGEFSESERVDRRHRAGAHGEDVADDAAHAGGRALERFDGAGMVVGFDLEGDGEAVADVDNAGIFLARAHEHAG